MFIDLLAGRKGIAFFIASKNRKKYGTWSFVNRWQYNSGLPSLYIFMFWNNSLDAPFSGNSCVVGFYFLVGFRSSDAHARLGAFPAVPLFPLHPCACDSAAVGFFRRGADGPPPWAPSLGAAGGGGGGRRRFRTIGTRGRCKAADCGSRCSPSLFLLLPAPQLALRMPTAAPGRKRVSSLLGNCAAGSALVLPILPDLKFWGSFKEWFVIDC